MKRREYREDITGHLFGRLLVIEKSDKLANDGSPRYWVCGCECGEKILVLKSSLISGNTKSCGCFRNNKSRDRLKGKPCLSGAVDPDKGWELTAKKMYRGYTDGDISYEKFVELSQLDCFYCGRGPLNRSNAVIGYLDYRQETKDSAWWVWNGLDRVDNTKGHTVDNVVPACRECNRMKMDMAKEHFFEVIKLIYVKHFVEKDR